MVGTGITAPCSYPPSCLAGNSSDKVWPSGLLAAHCILCLQSSRTKPSLSTSPLAYGLFLFSCLCLTSLSPSFPSSAPRQAHQVAVSHLPDPQGLHLPSDHCQWLWGARSNSHSMVQNPAFTKPQEWPPRPASPLHCSTPAAKASQHFAERSTSAKEFAPHWQPPPQTFLPLASYLPHSPPLCILAGTRMQLSHSLPGTPHCSGRSWLHMATPLQGSAYVK